MINTIRFPQLSPNFLCSVVAENEFMREITSKNQEHFQMLIGAIASSTGLSGFPIRSDSSRVIGPNDVYVFSNRIGQHISKYQFHVNFYILHLTKCNPIEY